MKYTTLTLTLSLFYLCFFLQWDWQCKYHVKLEVAFYKTLYMCQLIPFCIPFKVCSIYHIICMIYYILCLQLPFLQIIICEICENYWSQGRGWRRKRVPWIPCLWYGTGECWHPWLKMCHSVDFYSSSYI